MFFIRLQVPSFAVKFKRLLGCFHCNHMHCMFSIASSLHFAFAIVKYNLKGEMLILLGVKLQSSPFFLS